MAVIEKEEHRGTEIAAREARIFPPLTIDWDLFAEFLECSDAPEDEKKELVETVFAIMVSFVDLGFGIESTQHAIQAKRQDRASALLPFSDAVELASAPDSGDARCSQIDKNNKHKGDKE